MEALIRFLVITGIVLPLLPDTPIDPVYQVLRPRDVWRTVVLISGLSFVGYVLMRVRAGHGSHVVTGLLSGLVSSTAATLAYARAGRGIARARHYEALIALAASTAFVRIEIMLALTAPELAYRVAPALSAMLVAGLVLGFTRHRPETELPERHRFENPLTMRVALTYAVIYASVILLLAAARQQLGDAGTFAVSALASLVGADAPSLSLARLAQGGTLPLETATLAVVVVAIGTTLGKVGILLSVARGPFARRVAPTLVAVAAVGAAALLLLHHAG
jgi:uncharacterized membrane protein (DUF4010 family)